MTGLLVDAMCGDLRAYLRMCGHDAAYAPDRGLETDDELLATADREDRVLVTRDRQLAARADGAAGGGATGTDDAERAGGAAGTDGATCADGAILLESRDTERQLASLYEAGVDLELASEPRRCGACNGTVARVATGDETAPYAPAPAEESVWQCGDCGRYFWRGSHWERVGETLARVGAVSSSGE